MKSNWLIPLSANPVEKPGSDSEVQAYIAYARLKCGCGGGEVASWWVLSKGRRISPQSGTLSSLDTEKKKELWDRLDNESERAYRAFEVYRNLPSGERTLIEAYRQHVGNPLAVKPSDTWIKWSRDFAWSQRAMARDAHIDRLRERSMEKAIQQEAEEQARQAERMRGRYNELLAHGYLAAMDWLENAQPSDFRPSDIIQITRLHMDAVKAFEVAENPGAEVEWTEEELAELTQIIREIEAEEAEEEPEEDSDEGEEDSNESEDRPQ